jgi:hypothetical protein
MPEPKVKGKSKTGKTGRNGLLMAAACEHHMGIVVVLAINFS